MLGITGRNDMMYAQYLRFESKAGGVRCSNRDFIRVCRKALNKKGRTRGQRKLRHIWIRRGLATLACEKQRFIDERY